MMNLQNENSRLAYMLCLILSRIFTSTLSFLSFTSLPLNCPVRIKLPACCQLFSRKKPKSVFCWKMIGLYLLPVRINVPSKGFNTKRAGLLLLQIRGFLGPRYQVSPKQDWLYLGFCVKITLHIILSRLREIYLLLAQKFTKLPRSK